MDTAAESGVKKALGVRIAMLEQILKAREQELMDTKGPCFVQTCRLWKHHYGPCFDRAAD